MTPALKPKRSMFDEAEEELRQPGSMFDEAEAELGATSTPTLALAPAPVPGMSRLSPGGQPPAYPAAPTPTSLPAPPPTPTEAIVRRPLRSLAAGALSSVAGTGHLIKSTANAADRAFSQSPLGRLPGADTVRKLPQAIAQGGQQMEDFYGPPAEALRAQQPHDLQAKIYEGVGSAPIEIGKYLVAGGALGSGVRGMAAVGAAEGLEQGPQATAIGASKGALMGKALGYAAPATIPVRAGAMGTMFGSEAALSGGDASDVVSSAVVGGGLGMMGGPGQRMADLRRDPLKPRMMVQAQPEPPAPPPLANAQPPPTPMAIPPRPQPRPPVPAPTGLDALTRAQSQLGPAAEAIPDRLLGVTPYQRHLQSTLGPTASILPSRLTEAQTVAIPKPGMPDLPPRPPRQIPGPVVERPVGPPVGSQAPPPPLPARSGRPGRPVVRRPGTSGMATPDALTSGLASQISQESTDPTKPFSDIDPRPGERKEEILPVGAAAAAASATAAGKPPLASAIRDEFTATRGWADAAPAVLPTVLDSLESRGYSRSSAGKEILAMADRGEISLATHDHGPALPDAERSKLLYDPLTKDARGRDAYYTAATIREGFPTTPQDTPTKPLWEMGRNELDALYKSVKDVDKHSVIEIFGPEKAAQYERAQRTANSMDPQRADAAAKVIDSLESELTEAQYNRLVGINQPTLQYDVETVKAYRDGLRDLDFHSPEALGTSLKWALSKVGKNPDPMAMTESQRQAYAEIRYAYEEAVNLGWDLGVVSNSAIKALGSRFADAMDSRYMVEQFLRKADTNTSDDFGAPPPTSGAPLGLPSPRLTASPGERGSVSIDPAVAATVDFLAKGVRTAADRAVAESKEFAGIAHDLATNTTKGVKAAVSFIAPRLLTPQPIQDVIFEAKGERQRRAEAYSVTTRAFREQIRELPEADQIAMVDRAMTGKPQPTPELQTIADFAKDLTDEMYAQVKDAAPFAAYRENYGVGIQWKTAPKHPDWDLQSAGQGSDLKSLQGGAGFLKHRFWGSLSKGMEYGGVPASTNLVDLLGMDYANVTRFVTAQNIWKGLQDAGQVQWVPGLRTRTPEGLIRLDVDVAKSYFTPEGKKTYNGGYWAIAEGPGSMLKNFLSKDHWRNPSPEPGGATLMSLVGRGTMAVKNSYTMWELGFSFFHPMFVTAEAQLSYLGTAGRRLANLHTLPEAMTALKETLLVGTGVGAAAETAMIGRTAKKLFTEAAMAERGLSDAKSVDEVMALPQFARMAKRFPEAVEYVNEYFTGGGTLGLHSDYDANFRSAMMDALKQHRIFATAGNAVMALPEALSGPLFRHYIPALKLGTFMREYDLALKENAARLEAGTISRPEIARKTVEFVEDRFGEMNFDNLFWNKTFKTSLQMGFRSVTWILGNTRSMATALPQQISYTAGRLKGDTTIPLVSPKGAWQLGMLVFNAVLGSLATYAFTGENPKDIKDLIYPRYDKSDPKARMVLPTSIKEAQAFATHPLKRARGGISGIWGKTRDVVSNRDFMGNQIYNPDDDVLTQAKDVGGHLFPLPISVSSYQTAKRSGGSPVEKFGSALGFLKAPRYITDSPAIAAIREESQSRGINYTRTKQEAERAQAISGIARALAAGRDSVAQDLWKSARESGTVRDEDMDKILDRMDSQQDPNSELLNGIKSLPLISILNVWKAATPEQRMVMHPAMLDKFDSAMDTQSEDQLKVLIRKMDKVGWSTTMGSGSGSGSGKVGTTTP